ncbi:hypothetical protein OOZ51_04990 [Arthrobacter sp. MI7-26]|uniref:hypothetical protein n=1 Tax=Arthrobacter sp. MI7-26 TaxID=2993653 RepID=UPI0022491748|nr:hypothetical protein [Arthrobacter sp. MI7-26]MCX2747170.1 hypothetical protein [Arthrobacter sp. MI7-26]
MTWLKLGEEFTVEVGNLDLSDAAFRTHVEGLAFATDRENDGLFAEREIRRFAESPNAGEAAQELVDKGLWQRRADGKLQIIHHMAEQPTADYLRGKRQVEANRQRRHRETKVLEAQGLSGEAIEAVLQERGIPLAATDGKARKPRASGPNTTRDTTRDVTRDTTRDPERNGAELNGAERSSKEALDREALSFASSDVSSPAQSAQDQAWLAGEAVAVGVDPGKCTSPLCGGRVTDYNQGQGIRECLDCLRRGAK